MLVLAEMSGFILPLAYLICLTAAYIGPTAETLGNIKSSHWQYVAVEDLGKSAQNLLMFVGIDAISLVLSFFSLLFFCKVNLWKIFLHIQKEYGFVLAIQQAFFLEHCFCQLVVACASDFTFQFNWLFVDQQSNSTISK